MNGKLRAARAVLAALAVIGCTAAPSGPVRAAQAPTWTACGSITCTTVRVPLDWSRPTGEQITIGVGWAPATKPRERVGTLYFATGLAASSLDSLATNYSRLPAALRERFDLVAVGQRGFPHRSLAGTTTLHCGAEPAFGPLFPKTEAEYDRLVAGNRQRYAHCRAAGGDLVDHLDVDSQARDWDAVRALLHEDRVNVLTFVGGGAVAQQFAARYPERVRALALDGPLNRAAAGDQAYRLGARTARQELDRFAAWCAANAPVPDPPPVASSPTSGCALHGQDARAAYRSLIARAPANVPGIDHPLDADEVAALLSYFLVNGDVPPPGGGWVDLAATLLAAQRGNLVGLAAMYAASRGSATAGAGQVATCSTVPPPRGGWPALRARIEQVRRAGGDTLGHSSAWENSVGCTGWPVTGLPPVRTAVGVPAALFVVTAHDLYSPAAAVRALARRVPGSAILSNEDSGHIGYLQSGCVADAVNAFLVSGHAPTGGTGCP